MEHGGVNVQRPAGVTSEEVQRATAARLQTVTEQPPRQGDMADFDAAWAKFRDEHMDHMTADWEERRAKGKRGEEEKGSATFT